MIGIVLAAGAGARFGGPKALVRAGDGTPWLALAHTALRDGGCDEVVVVLGHGADEARALVPDGATAVVATRAQDGLSASVRAGLEAARERSPDAVVLVTVDTPGMPAEAVARVIEAVGSAPRRALVRATYGARPGHPVLIGADHLDALTASLTGDAGAGPYLRAQGATPVDCLDLWDGHDVDRRE